MTIIIKVKLHVIGYAGFTLEHFPLCQSLSLTTKMYCSLYIYLTLPFSITQLMPPMEKCHFASSTNFGGCNLHPSIWGLAHTTINFARTSIWRQFVRKVLRTLLCHCGYGFDVNTLHGK
jgi:hypothetical protein